MSCTRHPVVGCKAVFLHVDHGFAPVQGGSLHAERIRHLLSFDTYSNQRRKVFTLVGYVLNTISPALLSVVIVEV